jgi:hypothetical protein
MPASVPAVAPLGLPDRASCLAGARRPLKNVHGGRTAGTSLDAPAQSLARGASGVWLRAGSRLGSVWPAAAPFTFWSATSRSVSPSPCTGERARPRAAQGLCRRPCLRHGGGSRWSCSSLVSRRTRSPSCSRRCSGLPAAEGATGRWRQRAVSSWGCLLYSAFCLSTARLLLETPPRQTAQSEQGQDIDVTATVLRTGRGELLLILIGLLIMAAAVEMGRRSVWLHFRERFTAEHMSRPLAMVTRAVGAYGCIARSVVLVLVGFFIIKAAVLSSAKQVQGLDAVFRSVASSAGGAWLALLRAASSATAFIA